MAARLPKLRPVAEEVLQEACGEVVEWGWIEKRYKGAEMEVKELVAGGVFYAYL